MSRFVYNNPDIPNRLAKRLRTLLSANGVERNLSASREILADMLGFDSSHAMSRIGGSAPASAYDHQCTEAVSSLRRSRQVEALVGAGLSRDKAAEVIAVLRPTDRMAPAGEKVNPSSFLPWWDIKSIREVIPGLDFVECQFSSGYRMTSQLAGDLDPFYLPPPDRDGYYWFEEDREDCLIPLLLPSLNDSRWSLQSEGTVHRRYPGLIDARRVGMSSIDAIKEGLRPDAIIPRAPLPGEFFTLAMRGILFRGTIVSGHGPEIFSSTHGPDSISGSSCLGSSGVYPSDDTHAGTTPADWFVCKYDRNQPRIPLPRFDVFDLVTLRQAFGISVWSIEGDFWDSAASVALGRALRKQPSRFATLRGADDDHHIPAWSDKALSQPELEMETLYPRHSKEVAKSIEMRQGPLGKIPDFPGRTP